MTHLRRRLLLRCHLEEIGRLRPQTPLLTPARRPVAARPRMRRAAARAEEAPVTHCLSLITAARAEEVPITYCLSHFTAARAEEAPITHCSSLVTYCLSLITYHLSLITCHYSLCDAEGEGEEDDAAEPPLPGIHHVAHVVDDEGEVERDRVLFVEEVATLVTYHL